MPTPVFLTVDTELVWRHHAAGLAVSDIVRRSIDPAGVGLNHHLRRFNRHRLKATFFVDPMPAMLFGLDVIRRIVDPILTAGHDVQLHLHPNWTRARAGDGGATYAPFDMADYPLAEQRALIVGATELLVAAGAPSPIAFRAGCYGADDATLMALAGLGFAYDSSHNGAEHPHPSAIDLPPGQIAPVRRHGLVEVPVTVIEDRAGSYRPLQLCAVSAGEMRAALDHAVACEHAQVTIVSHSFELANRAGDRANAIHARRFDSLCEHLAGQRERLPTATFAERPALALDRSDRPLGPSTLRTRWRQAEQLWSNVVADRAA